MKYPIDWNAQWEAHGFNFKDGFVHFENIRLKPGPGFGDLSHPTTHLSVKLMRPLLKNKIVVDIGSGSGVLSLFAAANGAKEVIGIEIDPEAVEHAKENAKVNQLSVKFLLPEVLKTFPKGELLFVMNMIRTEQANAWSVLPLLDRPAQIITSGVMSQEKEIYLQEASKRGWELQNVEELDGWLGFQFNTE